MQPIIQHTVTITVTETWTITWQDGHETANEEPSTMVEPPAGESILEQPGDDTRSEQGTEGPEPTGPPTEPNRF